MVQQELKTAILRCIANPRADRRRYFLSQRIKQTLNLNYLHSLELDEAIWYLIAKGYAFWDMTQSASSNWDLCISAAGRAVLEEDANPADPRGYLKSLEHRVGILPPSVQCYLEEGLQAFAAELHLAATMMLGVAAEALFLEVAKSFAATLPPSLRPNYLTQLENPAISYVKKVEDFNKRLDTESLPRDLADRFDTHISGILDAIRTARNAVGHPTGAVVSRAECDASFRAAIHFFERMLKLRKHFSAIANANTASEGSS
jgi:hypothetical protein